MILIEVLVNLLKISLVCALNVNPNININFLNISEAERFTKIIYKLNVYKNALFPLNLDRYVDILMVEYYSREQKNIYTRRILFNDKNTGISIDEFDLILEPGNNNTVDLILKFKLQQSMKKIFNCSKKTDLIYYGKIYSMNSIAMKDFEAPEDIPKELEIYSRIIAYFAICKKYDQDFKSLCEKDIELCHDDNIGNWIVIFMIGGFIVAMNFTTLLVVLFSRPKRSSNRVSPLNTTW